MERDSKLPTLSLCKVKVQETFPSLTEDDLELFFASTSIRTYEKGELLYSENSRIHGCYFIFKGIIKIFQTGQEGKEQIIKFIQTGDICGFRSVIRRELACTSAQTFSDCILFHVPDKTILEMLQNHSGFAYDMLQVACKELGNSNHYIRDIAQKSVKSRLAEILLLLKQKFGTENDGTLKLNITREELSNFVGTATETVIRLLSEYKTEGLIETQGRKIRIINTEKMKTIAGF